MLDVVDAYVHAGLTAGAADMPARLLTLRDMVELERHERFRRGTRRCAAQRHVVSKRHSPGPSCWSRSGCGRMSAGTERLGPGLCPDHHRPLADALLPRARRAAIGGSSRRSRYSRRGESVPAAARTRHASTELPAPHVAGAGGRTSGGPSASSSDEVAPSRSRKGLRRVVGGRSGRWAGRGGRSPWLGVRSPRLGFGGRGSGFGGRGSGFGGRGSGFGRRRRR